MANSLIVAETFIISPESNNFVLSARDEVLTLSGDGKGIDLTFLTSVKHTDCFGIEGGPVGDFFVWTCGQELGFFGVVYDGLFEVLFFDGVNTSKCCKIPYNPRTIGGYRYRVLIVAFDLRRNKGQQKRIYNDIVNFLLMLL